jgi:hypothetical protein
VLLLGVEQLLAFREPLVPTSDCMGGHEAP